MPDLDPAISLVRTVERLLDEEGGFEPQQALTARLMLADTSFIEDGTQLQSAFVGTLLDRVRGLPGVQAAGVGSVLPPDDDPVSVELYEDKRGEASRREIVLAFGAVTRGYFAPLGTRLRAGRRFDAADNLAEAGPLILSETAARFFYPDRDPIGRLSPYGIDALDIAGRGVAGHRSRRRHEVRGARRAAGRHDLHPVAAGAHRRVPPGGYGPPAIR